MIRYLMHQHKFTSDLVEKFHCSNYNSVASPLDPSVKLTVNMGDPLPDPFIYRSFIGKRNFLQHTKLNISFVVQYLSQFLQYPCVPHMRVGLYVLRYLLNALDLGIFLSSSPSMSILAYADSNWAAFHQSRRSVTGSFITFSDCPIS